VIEGYNSGTKEGFRDLFISLTDCANTLEYADISDNKSVNNAIPELALMIKQCKNLRFLNISDIGIKNKHCDTISDAIVSALNSGSHLTTLHWNFTM